MSKKQAYLLTAYKDFDAVYELASFLCKEDDVYIHVDKKSVQLSEPELEKLNALNNCVAYKEYDIAWGGYNHVKALLSLMKRAVENPDVSYIHMLTGEDYLLKSPSKIHEQFIEDEHIYLSYIAERDFNEAVKKRYYYYNFFQDKNVKNKILWLIQDFTVLLQKKIGIKRKGLGEFDEIFKGLVYISMPVAAAKDILTYLTSHPDYEKDLYRRQLPEEFFFHTLLLNDEFCGGKWKSHIIDRELRYMNWERGDGGSPVYLEASDFEELAKSNCVFARKFHGKESAKLKERIRNELWNT